MRLNTNKLLEEEDDIRPTQIITSMRDFSPEDFGLPFFEPNHTSCRAAYIQRNYYGSSDRNQSVLRL